MPADRAPGRPRGRSGVLILGFLVALVGCDGGGGGATIALDSSEVAIAGTVHEIRLAGFGATDSIVPLDVRAAPGDAVTFVAADRRPHAPAFVVDELEPDARAFLDRTGQLLGPPLVNEGAAWVVLLEGAPPGRYPFLCRAHETRGTLIVTEEEQP